MTDVTSAMDASQWNRRIVWGLLATFIGCPGVTIAHGQVLLWDNDTGRWGTAAGHLTVPVRRSLLDDVAFQRPVILSDFSMLFIWNEGGVGRGEHVDLELWSDNGGRPDAPRLALEPLTYGEVWTGQEFFGRQLLDISQQVRSVWIESGTHWLDMHMFSQHYGFQLMTPVTRNGGWICYDDFPPCPRPGQEIFGFPSDYSFVLYGFNPGEATEGFIRSIRPLLFSGQPRGGVEELRDADDGYYILTAGPGVRVSRSASASAVFETTLPNFPLDRMDLRVQSLGTQLGVRQEVALFDYDARRWVVLDDQPLPFGGKDLIVLVENLGDPSRFINDADGQTRVRLEAYSTPVRVQPHQLKVNQVNLVLTYTP